MPFKDPERRCSYMREYYKTHPEYQRKNRQRNHDQISRQRWYIERKEKRRKIKEEIFNLLGNQCQQCHMTDHRGFQIDHVYGKGNQEMKSFKGNSDQYYQYILSEIKKGSKKYQLLCATCNMIKGSNL